MITKSEYNRHTAEWWIGKKVKVVKELQNFTIIVPSGTIMEIEGKRGGFSLIGERCKNCGIQPRINKVDPSKLILLASGGGYSGGVVTGRNLYRIPRG